MEYVITYGWAVLVITIALLFLAVIGAFNSRPTGNSCNPYPGYLCADPLMNTTGNLSLTFSEVQGYPMTITGIACTENNQEPVPSNITAEPDISLQSGDADKLTFVCPAAVGPIGTLFKGQLWVRYNTQVRNGQITHFAEISVQDSTMRSV